ncbi:hypothetical protein DL769_009878 [Monosporascus sp. CRB-8-3]|nr:hypothetical protein DL769_009878 [Monosporascus sp. CRB-8-3]
MRRFLRGLRKTAATGTAVEQDPLEQSTAAASSSTKTFPSGIKLLHGPEDAVVDIVFVHGLPGGREKTWTARDASEPWPKALLPSELPTARILTFGYDAYVTNWRDVVSQNRIGNYSWSLLVSLASYREKDDTVGAPAACGGSTALTGVERTTDCALVTLKGRPERHFQDILRSIRGIAFLGTPHYGAGLAQWAELLSRFIGVIKQTNTETLTALWNESKVLARIQDNFYTVAMAPSRKDLQRIKISCFYEELPLPGLGQVVPRHSAILPGCIPIGIRSNHIDMTRFTGVDDPGFTAVCGELRRWIKQMDMTERGHGNTESLQDGQDGRKGVTAQYFVGRSGILDRLKGQLGHRHFQRSGGLQPRVSLYGLGDCARVPGYDDPRTDVLPLVIRWLERNGGQWLMVIDNADDGNLQAGVWLTRGRRPIEVRGMDENESHQLLGAKLKEIDFDSGDMSRLSSRLEYLPLALVQAATYIQRTNVSVNEYLQLLDRSYPDVIDLLGEEFSTIWQDVDAPRAITDTWILSFEQIQRQNALAGELLSLMSFFDGQAIPLKFLYYYIRKRGAGRTERTRLITALGVLKAFSFVREGKDHNLDIQRLVQLVTRKWLLAKDTTHYFASQALLAVSSAYPLGKFENWVTCRKYLPHVYAVLQHEGTGSNDEMIGRASLLHCAAAYLHYQGQWEDAERFQLEAVELRKASLGGWHPGTLSSMANLASTYLNQGRWKEAESLVVRVTEARKNVLGKGHPDTLRSMENLAATYRKQGRWEKAEPLEEQVIEMRKKVLGEEHPDTLSSIANLASTYHTQGRWKEAELLEVQVMETFKRVLGEEHPNTLSSMLNLAATLSSQGRWKEAEPLEEQAVETRKRVLGEGHPDTLSSMASLASTYHSQGRWKGAELLEAQVMEIRKRTLGRVHPDTLRSMVNLAETLSCQGRWKEAESLGAQVMKTQESALGEVHTDTLRGINPAYLPAVDAYPASNGESDRETDVSSVFSEVESLFTIDSSVGAPGIRYIGIREVASALLSHSELKPLYITAISKVDEKKCRAHLKGFLKAYADSLKKEARDHLETRVANFVGSMAGRVSDEIRRAIVSPNDVVQLEEGPAKLMLEHQLATIIAESDTGRDGYPKGDGPSGGDGRSRRDEEFRGTLPESATGPATEDQPQTENCDDTSEPGVDRPFEVTEDLRGFILSARALEALVANMKSWLKIDEKRTEAEVDLSMGTTARAAARAESRYVSSFSMHSPGDPDMIIDFGVKKDWQEDDISRHEWIRQPTRQPLHRSDTSDSNDIATLDNHSADSGSEFGVNSGEQPTQPELQEDLSSPWPLGIAKCWYALMRILDPPPRNSTRIIYTCGCGELRYLDVEELAPGGADESQQSLRAHARAIRQHIYAGNIVKPELPGEEEVLRKRTYEYEPIRQQVKIISVPFFHELLRPGEHLGRFWWKRFPKKLKDVLSWNEDMECLGWGIHITEGWNTSLIITLALLLMSSFFIFVVVYSVLTQDGSTGAGIGSFMTAFLTLYCWLKGKWPHYAVLGETGNFAQDIAEL